jgi:hypothetical protein
MVRRRPGRWLPPAEKLAVTVAIVGTALLLLLAGGLIIYAGLRRRGDE